MAERQWRPARSMWAVGLVACGSLTGCGRPTPRPQSQNQNAPQAWNVSQAQISEDAMPIDASCVEALTAIADGDLARWRGLPACSRADVAAALGGSPDAPLSPGQFGDSTLYAARGAAPHGVTVWFDGDRATLVQINLPALARSVGDQLGTPEAIADSRLGELIEQRVFASRGLTAHVQEWDGEAIRLYGYAPMTAQAFLASPWATVRNIKDPDRR